MRVPRATIREKNKLRARLSVSGEKWRKDNKEYLQEYKRKYYTNPINKSKITAGHAKRRNSKKISEDADLNKILDLYKIAKKLEEKLGVSYHVDHLIPLSKGGRHHQDNMVVMRADYNKTKSSKIIPKLINFLVALLILLF